MGLWITEDVFLLELNVLDEGKELRGDACRHSVGSKSVGIGVSWGKLRASDTVFLCCFLRLP